MQHQKKVTPIKDLILLFSVPVAVALIAAAAVYLPRLAANPSYDFIYSSCSDYTCEDSYYVDSTGNVAQRMSEESSMSRYINNPLATLYYYDIANDSRRSLTFEQAQEYQLNTSSKSPDGYTLAKQENSSGFLFWGDSNEKWIVKDGLKRKNAQLTTDGSQYSQDATFLGWVKK